MPRKARSLIAVSLSACSMALPSLAEGSNSIRLQIFPAGQFRPEGVPAAGSVAECGYWYIDAAAASAVIARAQSRATKICVDYEHQLLNTKINGQPAPAAAWIDQATLEWVEGEGLFAMAALTARARDGVEADEWKYFSPVFLFDQKTGAVLDLKLGALTNFPCIDGMAPLTAAASQLFAADMAALSQDLSTTEDSNMDEALLEQLRWMLNLPVGATAEDIKAQLQKLIDQIKTGSPEAAAAASFDLAAHLTAQHSQLAALNQQIATPAKPDPALFVPVLVMQELQVQVAALSAQLGTASVDKTVEDAIAAGQLLPAQAEWARDLGRSNMAALSQFISEAPKIAALSGSQTTGKAPVAPVAGALDGAALAVCSMLGNDPAQVQQTLEGLTQ